MKKNELRVALKEKKVPDFLYNVDGTGRTDERLNLTYEDDHWVVFYEEKGIRTSNNFFITEDEACKYIYKTICENMEGIMKENNRYNYIPLGSIVLLKGATKKLLVISRAINVQNKGKQLFFDYGGVAYPEGLTGDQMAYFNSDAISKVLFYGFHDAEDENMIDNINSYLSTNPNLTKGSNETWEK